MIILNGKIFREASFINEEELENFVKSHYKIFFGEHSLYTSQFSVSTIGGKTSVPDGIAVDFKNRIWYVIEVELKTAWCMGPHNSASYEASCGCVESVREGKDSVLLHEDYKRK